MTPDQWADWLEKKTLNSLFGKTSIDNKFAFKIAKLLREYAAITDAIKDGGYDLSPCGQCCKPVVCLPDGLPCCEKCAEGE